MRRLHPAADLATLDATWAWWSRHGLADLWNAGAAPAAGDARMLREAAWQSLAASANRIVRVGTAARRRLGRLHAGDPGGPWQRLALVLTGSVAAFDAASDSDVDAMIVMESADYEGDRDLVQARFVAPLRDELGAGSDHCPVRIDDYVHLVDVARLRPDASTSTGYEDFCRILAGCPVARRRWLRAALASYRRGDPDLPREWLARGYLKLAAAKRRHLSRRTGPLERERSNLLRLCLTGLAVRLLPPSTWDLNHFRLAVLVRSKRAFDDAQWTAIHTGVLVAIRARGGDPDEAVPGAAAALEAAGDAALSALRNGVHGVP